MADRSFGPDIRALVDDEVPSAPWLEQRVMAALLEDAEGRGAQKARRASPLVAMATLAAIVIAVLTIGVLLGSQFARPSNTVPAGTPSRDGAVVRYRAMLDTDMNKIYSASYRGVLCTTRQTCVAITMKMKASTESLLSDIAATPVPAPISAQVGDVKAAAQQFVEQIDVAIAAMGIPGSDFIAIAFTPTTLGLDLAVAEVTCWPLAPVASSDLASSGGPSAWGYACALVPVPATSSS